ncbi:MAG TPA: hypothetical protein VF461_11320 [Gemmatimonadaceae bacterium]
MRYRSSLASLALSLALAAPVAAQSGPTTSAPATREAVTTYYPLYGVSGGIVVPAGRLSDDHTAGYGLQGFLEYAVPSQAYALRGEGMFQRFSLKNGRVGKNVNLFSIGPTVMYQVQQAPTQTYLAGGIAIYNATGEGTRPGFNFGGGLGFPLTGFWATADARMHVMLASGKPVLTLPLSVGVKF